ncbi:RidA family protein [Actinosynnema sp. NPDC047251]|uniref:Endoribonuclease L-PSP family protein n=1 Tax=Saccharothrix espanaensis (strain ATCC 51144 / DSM 44229 / JCM 9112 / NBRC 15066 / NRRL 15764) TaxID=1179773 RepID=K0K7F1_SACES|nr:RidA family protein [Saccharothrix espanaensis]CCH32538.1 Endoribonuclease L-PSP family protein [Saccharothrix espanaensis DSM 44229]
MIPPAGHYRPFVRAGDTVYVSGQVPRLPDGSYRPADVATETALALRNLAAVVAAAGGDRTCVVKVTAYLADVADFAEFDHAYAAHFGDWKPARTTVVAGLRSVKVEVDAVLHLPATGGDGE